MTIEEKRKLRKEIEEKISASKTNEKIHINQYELEDLLFDTVIEKVEKVNQYHYHYQENIQKKYLVWSGSFLSKIDLSEIEFDDVVWNVDDSYYVDNNIDSINMSKTNAKIDFSKSYDYKKNKELNISHCNFKGTNLKKSMSNVKDVNSINIIDSCFAKTKLNFEITPENIKHLYNNDFSECDLSKNTIDNEFLINNPNNNFNNSKIKIVADILTDDLYKNIYQYDYLNNCYLNGNVINSKNIIDDKAKEYLDKKEKDKYIKDLRKTLQEKKPSKYRKRKVHIEKNILEDLLFETKYIKFKDEIIKAKYLIWSGPFLSNIDLSEISFDDVVWSPTMWVDYYYGNNHENNEYYDEKYRFVPRKSEENPYELNGVKKIDLSNTNAKIDFDKSFFGKAQAGYNVIEHCNFENVDLSNNSFDHIYIDCSNLSNTNININFDIHPFIRNSDLSNNDFSNKEIPYYRIIDEDFENTSFNNTKINIKIDDINNFDEEIKDNFKDCLINGISSDSIFAEQKDKKDQEKYEFEKDEILSRLEAIRIEKKELMKKLSIIEENKKLK